jgi:cytochrome oxidase assembly protein ShyY1
VGRYAFLRQPRWLALGFLVLLVLPSFVLLSRWQLSRLDDRRYFNDLVTTHSSTPSATSSAGSP